VHMIMRAALDQAVQRQLVVRNVAHQASARRRPASKGPSRIWTPAELSAFLGAAHRQRLYSALHLAAHTGLRRGELIGLRWADLYEQTGRLSVCRTLQTVAGRPVEFGVKTAPTGEPSTSTTTRSTFSTGGESDSDTMICRTGPTRRSSPTPRDGLSTRNPLASSSTASWPGRDCRVSVSTTMPTSALCRPRPGNRCGGLATMCPW
jgi:hypothetical protein